MSAPPVTVRRGFVDLEAGQVHYRHAGPAGGRPMVLIHQSPGSSKQLEPLLQALAAGGRRCIAPDTAGNGDSDPLPLDQPGIGDLADRALAALDALAPGRFDLYGSHTGASIAMEIAIARPDRVRRLIIDGMGLYSGAMQADVLDRYAREIRPDAEATHLMKVWHFCRDQYLFWPYYNRTAEGRLPNGLPSDEALHDFVVEVLKALRSYHLSYRAAFRHPKQARLPLLRVPVMVVASTSDMLHGYFRDVAALVPGAVTAELLPWGDPDHHADAARRFAEFLDSDGDA
jgi:pimeloyl-ACP methyl ester carboxylesterase